MVNHIKIMAICLRDSKTQTSIARTMTYRNITLHTVNDNLKIKAFKRCNYHSLRFVQLY